VLARYGIKADSWAAEVVRQPGLFFLGGKEVIGEQGSISP
jgi:hypothetical protein